MIINDAKNVQNVVIFIDDLNDNPADFSKILKINIFTTNLKFNGDIPNSYPYDLDLIENNYNCTTKNLDFLSAQVNFIFSIKKLNEVAMQKFKNLKQCKYIYSSAQK